MSVLIEILAFTFDLIGKLLIAVTAIMVHSKVVSEKRIDKKVLKDIQKEEIFGVIGIAFVILGYILHVYLIGY